MKREKARSTTQDSPAPIPATSPDTASEGINPSAPSSGTEAFGTTEDERRELQDREKRPEASRTDAIGAGDTRRTSYPGNEAADNPAANAESPEKSRGKKNAPRRGAA